MVLTGCRRVAEDEPQDPERDGDHGQQEYAGQGVLLACTDFRVEQ